MVNFLKKIWKVNKTLGITIPKQYIKYLDLKAGDLVRVTIELLPDSVKSGVGNSSPKKTPTTPEEKEEEYY
jgi:antitoxin component of MazEF toxin-antitoxin module